ncbi:ComF family protein [Chiayiivirga flava]|uniref:ComF family protein n=1 Tax=Chiayiivirga flava TaxID=659595 RepID=A0A7W8FYZ5_9GAMM|nr:ComF family protein [Chiayiivirga flava]MBB5207651.1 ComF family protein [Chiayiivirga flava]
MLGESFARVGAALLPPRCLVCGAAGADADLCAACRGELPWNRACCARCALPLPAPAPDCGICQRRPPGFAATVAPLLYAAPVDRLLTRFKFHADLASGRLLADVLGAALAGRVQGLDFIVPVPLHRRRLAQRGYNQTLELARPVARRLGLRLAPGLLHRTRATAAQSELDGAARRRNVRGAFAAAGDLSGARILLLDDVVTTTTTVREAAATLLDAGAAVVHVGAVARAP